MPNALAQRVADSFQSRVEFEDISSSADTAAALAEATEELRCQPIRIEDGESMKIRVVKIAEEEYALVMSIHRINLEKPAGSTVFHRQF